MQFNKRIFVVCGLVLGASGLVPTDARAGLKNVNEVQIFGIIRPGPGSGQATQASGSLGAARASADSSQYIGCQTAIDVDLNAVVGTCWAKTGGFRVQCTVQDTLNVTDGAEEFIAQMRSVGPQSYIEFTYLGLSNSGTCTSLLVSNTSQERPPTL